MDNKTSYLVIDEGNSTIKVYYIKKNVIQWEWSSRSVENIITFLIQLQKKEVFHIIYVSVIRHSVLWEWLQKQTDVYRVRVESETFLNNRYQSVNTLGVDRWCAVHGAFIWKRQLPLVVIDIGTAITWDIVDKQKNYLGGSIAPGPELRFRALADYTSQLPKLTFDYHSPFLVGKNTQESIYSGVIAGLIAECRALILEYSQQYDNVTFFLTGGYRHFFEFYLKNVNFACSFLVPLGAYAIFQWKYHAANSASFFS